MNDQRTVAASTGLVIKMGSSSAILNWMFPTSFSSKNLRFRPNYCCVGGGSSTCQAPASGGGVPPLRPAAVWARRAGHGVGRRNSSTDFIEFLVPPPATTSRQQPSRVAPWLMLPPVFEGEGGGEMVYKFYKLEDGSVESIPKHLGGEDSDDQVPPDDAKVVGSSHGWLAFFDEKTTHVFLSNPISRRHIKLPRIDTLPNSELNLFHLGRRCISRVILSCSPEDQDGQCRAVTAFGPARRLAFCVPGVSTEWAPLGCTFDDFTVATYYHNGDGVRYTELSKEDFVFDYQQQQEVLLTSISPCEFCVVTHGCMRDDTYDDLTDPQEAGYAEMLDWNITNHPPPDSLAGGSRVYGVKMKQVQQHERFRMLYHECIQMQHLLYAGEELSTSPLIVHRFVNRGIGCINGDPKLAHPPIYMDLMDTFPYRTVDFLVLEINDEGNCLVVEDLKGLAIFVGMNHSFAIPAAKFPGILKPNSIYFTDACRITGLDPDVKKIYGGHDIGIFYYETKTISPCCYPCDFQSFRRIDPPPIWFTPNQI